MVNAIFLFYLLKKIFLDVSKLSFSCIFRYFAREVLNIFICIFIKRLLFMNMLPY
jgi:hypothetical protein